MTSKILKSILSVAMAVLVACFVLITGVLYQYFGSVQQSQLEEEMNLAVTGTELMGMSYLNSVNAEHYRLTLVAEDGTVLYDNRVAASTMENHGDREEIREALASGKGRSSRYSTTLTEQNVYEAVRLSDGNVLRISESRVTALTLVLGMLQPLSWIILIAIILSAWLANRMAKRVVEPLNKLDLENPLENDAYEELSPLLRRIHVQQLKIKGQMKTLKQKQDEFDQITGNMKETLVLLDNNDKVVSINPAAKSWFEAGDCVGEDFMVIDRRQNMRDAEEEAKEKGSSSFRETRNGLEYQFELNRIDSDGKNMGIVILGFDITEQVNAEQNRREFTANVSHELKTPLQSIIGSAELMENGIVKKEDMPRFVGHIRKEAARLLCLIEDIIRLSQLDEGSEMPREEVSLGALAEEVCESLGGVAKNKEVSLEIEGDSGTITGVRRLLYEIIFNLCDNAIKYNRVGGSVMISVKDQFDKVRLTVKDTGIGIAPENQEKVFERFYRVDKSHSKQSGGTGLGLSIVKHAVQYHHGKISMESIPEVGTTISVLFDKKVPEEE